MPRTPLFPRFLRRRGNRTGPRLRDAAASECGDRINLKGSVGVIFSARPDLLREGPETETGRGNPKSKYYRGEEKGGNVGKRKSLRRRLLAPRLFVGSGRPGLTGARL